MTTILIASLALALAILCAAVLRRPVAFLLRAYDQWERETFPGMERLRWRHYLEWSGRVVWVVVLAALAIMGR